LDATRSTADGGTGKGGGRYWALFVASVLMIVLQPVVGRDDPTGPWGTGALQVGLLVAGLIAIWRHRRVSGVTAIVVMLAVAGLVGDGIMGYRGTTTIGVEAAIFVVLALVGVMMFLDVMRAPRVTADTLFAAACIYLVMGLWWARLYLFVEWASPGSYVPGLADGLGFEVVGEQFVYYSFVTLSTLGYGDVLPVSAVARNLAALEAVIGQLYVAILIGRLVGLAMRDEA
jgi:hypothetical protein